jgi:hypothetical protein
MKKEVKKAAPKKEAPKKEAAEKEVKKAPKAEMTAEKNYVFNTKKPIPAGMEIAFKDGNKENIKFSNLKLVKKCE